MGNELGATVGPSRVRYLVLLLVGMAPACAYLTRIISAYNTTIGAEFQINNEEVGDVIAGFALGYFVFQVVGGILASSLGVRMMLPVMGIGWSLWALWGSRATSANELYWSRVVMGVAQAGLVPCCATVAADWFPVKRRGLVSAVLTGSMQVGGIVATWLPGQLLGVGFWRSFLAAYGYVGIAWSVAFFLWFRNRPQDHAATNDAERELIRAGRQPATNAPAGARRADWLRLVVALVSNVSLLAFFAQALFRAYGYEFFTSWFPAYLEKAFAVDKTHATELATWPMVAFATGSLFGGVIVDWVLIVSGSRWLSRCGLSIAALGGAAGCFALATTHDEPYFVVAMLTAACLFAALGGPTTWAAGMDLGGRYTAVVFGVMNMIGNIGAFLCPPQVGMLLDYIVETSASWHLVLWLFAGVHLAGAALTWIFVDPRRPAVE